MIKLNSAVGTGALMILAAIAAYWVGITVTQARGGREHSHADGPPRPAWVRADGTVDVEQMPSCIPALGADGKILVDRAGSEVCIPKHELVGPPPSAPAGRTPDEISRRVDAEGGEHVIVGPAKRRDQ